MLMSEKSSLSAFGSWKVQLVKVHPLKLKLGCVAVCGGLYGVRNLVPRKRGIPILSPVLEQADTLARISNCVGRNEAFA